MNNTPVKNKLDQTLPIHSEPRQNITPNLNTLEDELSEAGMLVSDTILKNYLLELDSLELIPLPDDMKKIDDIRIFRITEMVYQKDGYATHKFASVYSSVQNLNCGVFLIVQSNGEKTDFYMGVRAFDDKRTTKSLKDTIKNALCGHFPGVKTEDFFDDNAEEVLKSIPNKNIVSVSCVANNKDIEKRDDENFIQGLEKLALAMQGQKYTAIILSKSMPQEDLRATRGAYESIFSQISPFANMQLSYGTNEALSISQALSAGKTEGTAYTYNTSQQTGTSESTNESKNESVSKPSLGGALAKGVLAAGVNIASILTAPLTGGASFLAAGAIMAASTAASSIPVSTNTKGTSSGTASTVNTSSTEGKSYSSNNSINETKTDTNMHSKGKSENLQLTKQNKSLINILDRIDIQLKRIDECESLGMWECASYFLSDSQETAEMAAGTYKALMNGEKSGVEVSAINTWKATKDKALTPLHEYITNFIHPVFLYGSQTQILPVTAASLVSSNELAIHMGLPRKSVCGFPVVEHADFAHEVVRDSKKNEKRISIGRISVLGNETKTEVDLNINSLSAHTFITGSTGAGKSNVVYTLLHKLWREKHIPFLIIEPAKGEYKDVFGGYDKVNVFGASPFHTPLLRVNPFSFPKEIHIIEHIDRLIEILNAVWPMYSAMPAFLKSAIEETYKQNGWNLITSENKYGESIFPDFFDLLEVLPELIEKSQYSTEVKGNYIGALVTRVESLTKGYYRNIFTKNEIDDAVLFNHPCILDFSRVGSSETKALFMGIIFMKLHEYRLAKAQSTNSVLKHITVLEEAHNLLRRTSSEQSMEGANLQGKSVEMMTNAIAEMRTYGEGFIIADQAPGLLDQSVIRNTNTKIILRLPDLSDRELVGRAANLNDAQIEELARLRTGCAAIYQNNWQETVLCQVDEFKNTENDVKIRPFEYDRSRQSLSDSREQAKIDLLQILFTMSETHMSFDDSCKEVSTETITHISKYYPLTTKVFFKEYTQTQIQENIFELLQLSKITKQVVETLKPSSSKLFFELLVKNVFNTLDVNFYDKKFVKNVLEAIFLYLELGNRRNLYFCRRERQDIESWISKMS